MHLYQLPKSSVLPHQPEVMYHRHYATQSNAVSYIKVHLIVDIVYILENVNSRQPWCFDNKSIFVIVGHKWNKLFSL